MAQPRYVRLIHQSCLHVCSLRASGSLHYAGFAATMEGVRKALSTRQVLPPPGPPLPSESACPAALPHLCRGKAPLRRLVSQYTYGLPPSRKRAQRMALEQAAALGSGEEVEIEVEMPGVLMAALVGAEVMEHEELLASSEEAQAQAARLAGDDEAEAAELRQWQQPIPAAAGAAEAAQAAAASEQPAAAAAAAVEGAGAWGVLDSDEQLLQAAEAVQASLGVEAAPRQARASRRAAHPAAASTDSGSSSSSLAAMIGELRNKG